MGWEISLTKKERQKLRMEEARTRRLVQSQIRALEPQVLLTPLECEMVESFAKVERGREVFLFRKNGHVLVLVDGEVCGEVSTRDRARVESLINGGPAALGTIATDLDPLGTFLVNPHDLRTYGRQ